MVNLDSLTKEIAEINQNIQEMVQQGKTYTKEIEAIDDAKFKDVVDTFQQLYSIVEDNHFGSSLLFNSRIKINGNYIHLGLYDSDGTLELKVYTSPDEEYTQGQDRDFIQWIALHHSYSRTIERLTNVVSKEFIKALKENWETIEPSIVEEFSKSIKSRLNKKFKEAANATNNILTQLKAKQAEC